MTVRSPACCSQSATTRWTCGTLRRRRSGRGGKRPTRRPAAAPLLALPPLEPDEETITEHYRDGVPMERIVAPALELVPPQFALRFFVVLLDPVSPMRILD